MTTADMIHTLISRGDYDALRGFHQTLRSAAICLNEDQDKPLFCLLLDYAERYNMYPSYAQLEAYILNSRHVGGKLNHDLLALRLKELAKTQDATAIHAGSWTQIMDDYTHAGRTAYHRAGLLHALQILVGGVLGDPKMKTKNMAGPDDMMRFLMENAAKDFTLPSVAPEGAWRENADLSADAMIDGLKDSIKSRCYTGFKHIDEALAIGPQQTIRYVGILGFSNHGKSTLLRTMAYSMAKSGKRILYIAREDSALNTWGQLSFLHSYQRPDLNLPAASVWKSQPQRVTAEHLDNLRLLIDDLQHGTSVPGEIVVKTCPTWAEIIRELEVGLNGKPYDVLMVDYLVHLDVGVTGQKMHDEIKGIFKKAQSLSLDYKGGRGLVVITPIQSNKAGMKAADELEGAEWGVYPDLGSVEMYTDAARDLDLIIGCWHKGTLRNQDIFKLSCIKSRERFFEPHFVQIDRRTRMVSDLPGGPKCDVGQISTYRSEAMDATITKEELRAHSY